MSLPDLALQIVYGRLAWALVSAALLLAMAPALWSTLKLPFLSKLSQQPTPAAATARARSVTAGVVAASMLLMALPDAASPAYWLTLVFQYPSALLVGCSVVSLVARWRGESVRFIMAPGFALPLVAAGLLLYLDAFGVLALGLYAGGFGAVFAPLLACAAVAVAALAIVGGRATGGGAAMVIGVLLFSLLRLPSGNLWDALLDPLLWSWALGSVVVAMARQSAARKAGRLAPQAAPEGADGADLPEPVLAHAAGNEQI